MGKNKNIDTSNNNSAFKCKGCNAYTFGGPVRINGQNYCKYCVEKEGIKPET